MKRFTYSSCLSFLSLKALCSWFMKGIYWHEKWREKRVCFHFDELLHSWSVFAGWLGLNIDSVFSLEQQVTCKEAVISQHLQQEHRKWMCSACIKWDIGCSRKQHWEWKLTLLATKYNWVLHVGALLQILSGTHSCTLCLRSPLM